MGDDPFYVKMTHESNRQYNRQNPSFDSRPPDFGHLASNAKWPEAQRWHSAGPAKPRSAKAARASGGGEGPTAGLLGLVVVVVGGAARRGGATFMRSCRRP